MLHPIWRSGRTLVSLVPIMVFIQLNLFSSWGQYGRDCVGVGFISLVSCGICPYPYFGQPLFLFLGYLVINFPRVSIYFQCILDISVLSRFIGIWHKGWYLESSGDCYVPGWF